MSSDADCHRENPFSFPKLVSFRYTTKASIEQILNYYYTGHRDWGQPNISRSKLSWPTRLFDQSSPKQTHAAHGNYFRIVIGHKTLPKL